VVFTSVSVQDSGEPANSFVNEISARMPYLTSLAQDILMFSHLTKLTISSHFPLFRIVIGGIIPLIIILSLSLLLTLVALLMLVF
jgi:hypothetical protein